MQIKDSCTRVIIIASFIIKKKWKQSYSQQRRQRYTNYSVFIEYYTTIENFIFKDFKIVKGNVHAIPCLVKNEKLKNKTEYRM